MVAQPYYMGDLYGMIHRQDISKTPDGSALVLQNISLDSPGSWAKRKGSKRLGASVSGTTQVEIEYNTTAGSKVLRRVRNGAIETYNPIDDEWTELVPAAATGFATDSNMKAANFKNRVYYISESDYLTWENGDGTVTVANDASGNQLTGTDIAVSQRTLYVAHDDKVYFSKLDEANNEPTDQFWNDSEGSLALSTRYFTTITKCIGVVSYNNLLYAFTDSRCYAADIRDLENPLVGVIEAFQIGLAGKNAYWIQNGFLIWMSPDGRIWAFAGTGQPRELSYPINDDEGGESIISKISSAGITSVAAGGIGNKVFFSIGDIEYRNETFENVVLVGHISQSFSSTFWSFYTYPWKPKMYNYRTENNKLKLVFSTEDNGNIYQVGYGANDDGIAITGRCVTKFYDLGTLMFTNDLSQLYVEYTPQYDASGSAIYIGAKIAVNGIYDYTTITDPDNATPVTSFGVINATTTNINQFEDIGKVNIPPSITGRTVSLEFFNNELDQTFEITAFAITVSSRRSIDKRIE